jgi:hypothetical protein
VLRRLRRWPSPAAAENRSFQSDLAPPALVSFFVHFPELVLDACALWAVGHVGCPFAKFVFSMPEVFTMLRVSRRGRSLAISRWRRLAVSGRGRRRRLTNRDLTEARHPDLGLSMR